MSYRVVLAPSVLVNMKNLPDAALTALVERTADLIEEPWDAQVLYPGRRDYRQATFGDLGLIHFHVDDDVELITIYELVWAG
ncbi:hypothetical protein [Microbispora catharanthi]|uniref:Type II toxin-antitoxin system RelE/ParE family toxin n=1 Tax=Microbispora catharanthi TaxID=1712871 RepID=A0A5N6BQX1_9ACTN|nr:hypothetical protein [Microbispora catharanthi]KAB8182838.1 hypothetical protein FH610_022925 [Microbispora catharanthi]